MTTPQKDKVTDRGLGCWCHPGGFTWNCHTAAFGAVPLRPQVSGSGRGAIVITRRRVPRQSFVVAGAGKARLAPRCVWWGSGQCPQTLRVGCAGSLRREYFEKEQINAPRQTIPQAWLRDLVPRRRGDLPFCGHRDSSLYRRIHLCGAGLRIPEAFCSFLKYSPRSVPQNMQREYRMLFPWQRRPSGARCPRGRHSGQAASSTGRSRCIGWARSVRRRAR